MNVYVYRVECIYIATLVGYRDSGQTNIVYLLRTQHGPSSPGQRGPNLADHRCAVCVLCLFGALDLQTSQHWKEER